MECLKNHTNFFTLSKSDFDDVLEEQSANAGMPNLNESSGGSISAENVDFHTEMEPEIISMIPRQIDYTYSSNDFTTSQLGNWLARPRRILSQTWTVGSNYADVNFFPWIELLQGTGSAFLQNKLNQYMLLRGDMKLTFMINGSQFHYGLSRACYRPGAFDNSYPNNLAARAALVPTNYNGLTFPCMLTTYSQRPGVWIVPGLSTVTEMKIPFFYPKNYIDLRSVTADLQHLGFVKMYIQNVLRHSNGAVDPVTITIFASIENAVLSTPTQQDVFLAESNDEYGKGVISKPMSALARFAGKMSDVPIIGKYAMATQIGASSVGKISSLWGYSKPINLESTKPIRPVLLGNFANYSGEDTIMKLSLDPKQEVSVDPSTVGIDSTDQMSIAYVAQRESLLTTFFWNTTQTANALIFGMKIHPRIFPRCVTTGVVTQAHFPTALAFAAAPFEAWRGAIRVRIQVVNPMNIKGKLLVQYDPQHNGASDTPNLQSRFSEVMDISTNGDMTFSINYNRTEMFLPTFWGLNSTSDVTAAFPSATFISENKIGSNGVLLISILNVLSAPIVTATVDVNVYVSAGDDMIFRNPSRTILSSVSYNEGATLAGQVSFAGDGGEELEDVLEEQSGFSPRGDCEFEVEQCKYHVINGTTEGVISEDLDKVCYGEQIVSFRQLLRRYNLSEVVKLTANPAGQLKTLTIDRMNIPIGPGRAYGNSLPAFTTTGGLYHYPEFTIFRYLMGGYMGLKGGIRYKYMSVQANNVPDTFYMYAQRATNFRSTATLSSTFGQTLMNGVDSPAQFADRWQQILDDTGAKAGMCMTDYHQNRVVEFDCPWQSSMRFCFNHEFLYANDLPVNYAWNDLQKMHHKVVTIFGQNISLVNVAQFGYVATGEDFSMFHFSNAPIMYVRVPPVPI